MEAKTQAPTLEESTIVERVARIVSSVRGTKPDYAHLAAELEPAIPFDIFGIVLLRHDRQALRVTICKRQRDGWVAHYHQRPLKDSMVERTLDSISYSRDTEDLEPTKTELRTHVEVVEVDLNSSVGAIMVQNYPDGLDGLPAQSGDALSGNPHLHATLIAPLIVSDRVLGTLELGSIVRNAYADETLQRLISAVARVLAAAIESAQVGGSVEIQDRQRQALKNVSSALTSEMDLSMILNRIVVGIAKALNVASTIVTFDQQTGHLRMEAQFGLDPVVLKKMIGNEEALSERTIIGFTLLRHQPYVSHDIAQDERFPGSQRFASELAIRSIFSYPLVTGTKVYGALLLCSPEPGGFTPLKADILSLFASQATIAIHNGMLLESARERRRFQEAIVALLSSVSHELRTPLTTIKAAVTGLLQPGIDWDEEMRREILEEIDAETDHLGALVNSLVEMSRIEMGALVLEKEWCDVVEILHGTLSRLPSVLADHPIRTQFQPRLPLISADYVQLERVFHNLIENAARQSPQSAEILIMLDVVPGKHLGDDVAEHPFHFLRARVIDHGDGVPEGERERIFKTFNSLDSQRAGLGLAICRGIVEAHQGRIWVEPAPDRGSCFVFVLPIFS